MDRRILILLALLGAGSCTTRNPVYRPEPGPDGSLPADDRGQPPLRSDAWSDLMSRPDIIAPPTCGNGFCQPAKGETCQNCPRDCGQCCGNGKCEPLFGESCQTCPADCECTKCLELEAQYAQTLQQAKSCSPMRSALQCEAIVQDAIACGCPTRVNSAHKQAITLLGQLQQQYQNEKCQKGPCLGGPCPIPIFAICMPTASGTGGSCVDQ